MSKSILQIKNELDKMFPPIAGWMMALAFGFGMITGMGMIIFSR
jgi:hypothetical protein